MTIIAKEDELLSNIFMAKYNILDSRLYKMEIFDENFLLVIDLYFELITNGTPIKLRFYDVQEYGFYWKDRTNFYIERYKLFRVKELFYLSIDPVDEENQFKLEDNDFIWSKSIEGYLL